MFIYFHGHRSQSATQLPHLVVTRDTVALLQFGDDAVFAGCAIAAEDPRLQLMAAVGVSTRNKLSQPDPASEADHHPEQDLAVVRSVLFAEHAEF